jgi:hypothetical protein
MSTCVCGVQHYLLAINCSEITFKLERSDVLENDDIFGRLVTRAKKLLSPVRHTLDYETVNLEEFIASLNA